MRKRIYHFSSCDFNSIRSLCLCFPEIYSTVKSYFGQIFWGKFINSWRTQFKEGTLKVLKIIYTPGTAKTLLLHINRYLRKRSKHTNYHRPVLQFNLSSVLRPIKFLRLDEKNHLALCQRKRIKTFFVNIYLIFIMIILLKMKIKTPSHSDMYT